MEIGFMLWPSSERQISAEFDHTVQKVLSGHPILEAKFLFPSYWADDELSEEYTRESDLLLGKSHKSRSDSWIAGSNP